MKILPAHGADLFVRNLETLGLEVIFGIPGSHDTYLYNSLRKSSIRTVLATSELHAAFMANGYYRNSGKTAALLAIAGPGFTNAITGLTEAFFDSAGMVCIICKPDKLPGSKFQLQKIDEKAMVKTVTKSCLSVAAVSDIAAALPACFELASKGEPGPVLLEVSPGMLGRKGDFTKSEEPAAPQAAPAIDDTAIEEVLRFIRSSRRAVLYLGQGAAAAAHRIAELAELLQAPVLTTTSGRGILPESHPLSLPSDLVDDVGLVNSILASSDCVLALGCKFTHNGAKGFRLEIPEDRLIHVDASPEVPGANYPARLTVTADADLFLDALFRERDSLQQRDTGWESEEIEQQRQALIKSRHKRTFPEPQFRGMNPPTASAFFSSLRHVLPEETVLVTDSGLHQMLARKYFDVTVPRGLIVPADYQSMGFGIPAGIGARLANQERHTVVITGDGGFALCGMELSTAVREKIDMTVILFNDNSMGLIRIHQLNRTGHSHAVKTGRIDYAGFCESLGIHYSKLDNDIHDTVEKSLAGGGVSLIEVVLEDTLDISKASAKGLIRNILKI